MKLGPTMKTDVYVKFLWRNLIFLFVGLTCGPAGAQAVKLELVSAGLIELDGADYSSPRELKAMYPVVVDDRLIFLIVNEELGRQKDIIYSVPLSDVISKNSHIPKKKNRRFQISQKGGAFGGHERSLFYSIFSDGTSIRQEGSHNTLVDTVGHLGEKKLKSGKGPPRDLKRSKQSFLKGLWLDENSLTRNKKEIFRCGDPVSFSERTLPDKNYSLIVNFFDSQNIPRLAKVTKTARGKKCNGSTLTGFEPHLSPGGDKFSFLRVNGKHRDQSDLYIYSYKNFQKIDNSPISNVKLYDIKIHDFKYKKSISWIKNKKIDSLYYIPNGPENRIVGRIDCTKKNCKRPIHLKVPKCFYLAPPNKKDPQNIENWATEDPTVSTYPIVGWMRGGGGKETCINPDVLSRAVLSVSEIIWAVPFNFKGRRFIAAQAIVKGSLKMMKDEGTELHQQAGWAPRIVILRSKN